MELDELDLKMGLRFIVGKWQVEYLVNAFSNDLAHIPASEFKSEDGRDFSVITYEFFEDHTMRMLDTSTGREEKGAWEQTGMSRYHYTLGAFLELPEGAFRDAAETLEVLDGRLVFSIGFLAVAMNKIEDGIVTKEPDIGDKTPSAEDEALMGIVGRYAVEKAFSMVGDDLGLHARSEVEADLKRRADAGEIDEEDMAIQLQGFNCMVEFTPDHRVITWMKVPDGVSEEDIKAALECGEIKAYENGMFSADVKEWKAVEGKYYYNSGEHRELFGEEVSPWDELVFGEDGLLPFGSGMMMLKKLN